MLACILFPTDFSPSASAVFACLPELKVAGMREVVLLGSIRPEGYSLGPAFEARSARIWFIRSAGASPTTGVISWVGSSSRPGGRVLTGRVPSASWGLGFGAGGECSTTS